MSARILQGNNLDVLGTLEPESIQTCVTSPPYWGLRDYGTARWIGGNDPDCTHSEKRGGNGSASAKQVTSAGTQGYQYRDTCPKCGAVREDEQIGLEETPEAYVNRLVEVFRGVWRALKDDGTLWLNLGDSYAGSGGAGGWNKDRNGAKDNPNRMVEGIKPKDLVGIPWMVAFALRADGWYLRSEIIWHKTNPMPESVADRPTRAHEQIFLLSKSGKYFCDMNAIKEPSTQHPADWNPDGTMKRASKKRGDFGGKGPSVEGREPFRAISPARNKRDVWTVSTKPCRGAHFATFPPDLIEPCILAGSRPGDIVLDPFNGAGTTGYVSLKHGRGYVGIELNPAYVELTHTRLFGTQPYLYGVGANA